MLSRDLASRALRVGQSLKNLQRTAADHLTQPSLHRYLEGSASRRVLAVPGCLRLGDPIAGKAHPFARAARANGQQGAREAIAELLQKANEDALVDLHAFTWVADLKAVGTAQSATRARFGVAAWIARRAREMPLATAPSVVATRVRNCLAHADVLLADCDTQTYDATLALLDADLDTIEGHLKARVAGFDRLAGLMAVVLSGLVVDGREDLRETYEAALLQELETQILPDGGHISRDATCACEIVLDLVPLLRMYAYLGETPPMPMTDARRRLQSFLRSMRIGSTRFAGFSGLSRGRMTDDFARILKLDPHAEPFTFAEQSGFARMEVGTLVLLADVGASEVVCAPQTIRASLGAFEVSVAGRPLIVSPGPEATPEVRNWCQGRASNTHSLLYFDPHTLAYWQSQTTADDGPDCVAGWRSGADARNVAQLHREFRAADDAPQITLTHDAFARELGLRHARVIDVDAEGTLVSGQDRLFGALGHVRFARDLPFSIHFHIADDVTLALTGAPGEIALRLGCGSIVRFRCTGGQVGVEPSPRMARSGRVRVGHQIVVRAATHGETTVDWSFALTHRNRADSDDTA